MQVCLSYPDSGQSRYKLVTGLPKTNNKATGDAFFSVKILRGPEPGEVARQITWGSVQPEPSGQNLTN